MVSQLVLGHSISSLFQCHSEILQISDIDTQDKIYKLTENANLIIAAPDCAVDPDSRADIVFQNRNNSLLYIVENLFKQDHKKVVIWANNGIGKTVDEESNEDGVLRDEKDS